MFIRWVSLRPLLQPLLLLVVLLCIGNLMTKINYYELIRI